MEFACNKRAVVAAAEEGTGGGLPELHAAEMPCFTGPPARCDGHVQLAGGLRPRPFEATTDRHYAAVTLRKHRRWTREACAGRPAVFDRGWFSVPSEDVLVLPPPNNLAEAVAVKPELRIP